MFKHFNFFLKNKNFKILKKYKILNIKKMKKIKKIKIKTFCSKPQKIFKKEIICFPKNTN